MKTDYEKQCIEEISQKTGIGEKKVEKYFLKNNKNLENTLKEIYEKLENGSLEIQPQEVGGIVFGNISNASTTYGMDKFQTPRGHGFAAERANHLYDKIKQGDLFGQGKVQLVGDDIDPQTGRIIKNGADRIVNNVSIQTKYCSSGSKCISECFDNGQFRYFNADGSPMQIEVPLDKYDDAVRAMENRIKRGEVKGITDPKQAKEIVRKGNFTYEQAKNIAKFGTIESIGFDAVNGLITSTYTFGISSLMTFAVSIWNGEDFEVALKQAAHSGIKVGGLTFISSVLSSQISRTGVNSMLVGGTEAMVQFMGPKASAMLVNAFRSGSNIYGAAAMKSAAKMLRGNIITGAISVAVLSTADVVNIFRGRISGAQLFKNVVNTASTVAGGTVGWTAGATIGATVGSVIPVVGTAIGGIVGGLFGSIAGGSVSGKVVGAVMDNFIEDDANQMVAIIEKQFVQLVNDYLLNKTEIETITEQLSEELTPSTLKDMFASDDQEEFAKDLLVNIVENEVKKRKKIALPTDEEMTRGLRIALEEMSDLAMAEV